MLQKEIYQHLLFSEKPSDFLIFMRRNNLLADYPELFSLIITPQEPDWHPEGTVWNHSLMVLDVAAEFRHHYPAEQAAAEFMFGALCHDFGKPYTTVFAKNKFKSPMHDSLGLAPTNTFLVRLGLDHLIPKVEKYVLEHLKPIHLYKVRDSVSDSAIRKLSERINLLDLVNLSRCDHWGRTDREAIERTYVAGDWLLERYKNLKKK